MSNLLDIPLYELYEPIMNLFKVADTYDKILQ